MKDLLDKIGSYNLFNNLLPGALFAAFVDAFSNIKLIQKDIIVGAFVYYFLGIIVSRFGSLIVEPLSKKLKFVKFAPYENYIIDSKNVPKLEILSVSNNMYRTFCALLLLIGLVILYDDASKFFNWLNTYISYICVFSLMVLFLFSYKKQTKFITKRIDANLK